MESSGVLKLSGALMNGEVVGRVLRSQVRKVVLNPKLRVDPDNPVKAKTGEKKRKGKREAGVAEQGARQRKTRKKSVAVSETSTVRLSSGSLRTDDLFTELGLAERIRSDGATRVTISSAKCSWSVSLSSADAIAEATKHLVAADAKLGGIIGKQGAQGPVFEQEGSCFTALVRSIVYQQLAGKAAATIHGRLVALCGGPESVIPAGIAALTAEELRAVGISGRKALYLHDLAAKFLSGALADEKLVAMSEDDLVTALTAVKGIGVWSAHMFMIFYLHKPDVLPVGDLGIRKGFQRLFQLKKQPSAVEMQELANSWRPYRSLASWYLWHINDIKVPDS